MFVKFQQTDIRSYVPCRQMILLSVRTIAVTGSRDEGGLKDLSSSTGAD